MDEHKHDGKKDARVRYFPMIIALLDPFDRLCR